MKKVALITGGTGGLGSVLVEKLLQMDYHVISISRDSKRIEEAKEKLAGKAVIFFQGDVSDESVVDEIYEYILATYGYLDVLIQNVGIMAGGGIEDISVKQWEHLFEINVHVPFAITKKMLRLLKRADSASIVNISSIASKITGGCMAYSASKAALDMMTKSLAKELSKYYIRVNSVNPGLIDTGFQIKNHLIEESQYEDFLEKTANAYPLGTGSPEDVANLVCYLISDKGKWITGSNFIIDGGRSVNC